MFNSYTQSIPKHIATVRIVFGLFWAVDAALKFRPSFESDFLQIVKSAADGQPAWLQPWFSFWIHFLSINTHLFAKSILVIEVLIALALIFGIARKLTYLLAALFSFLVWSIPEGFGGPYDQNVNDIGASIIYVVVFFSLYGLERLAPPAWALDNVIIKHLPWWTFIANPKRANDPHST